MLDETRKENKERQARDKRAALLKKDLKCQFQTRAAEAPDKCHARLVQNRQSMAKSQECLQADLRYLEQLLIPSVIIKWNDRQNNDENANIVQTKVYE